MRPPSSGDGERTEVSDLLMRALTRQGVANLWFTSGSELAFFQEAYAKGRALGRGVPQLRTVPHEHVGLAAASGETRVTGHPSAMVAHVDVGLLNMGGAIHNAFRGGYPVLMMSGYAPSAPPGTCRGGRDSYIQWFQQPRDQGEIVRQYTKWDHRLAAFDVPDLVIARAIQMMMTPPRGPAYLAISREVAMAEARQGGQREIPLSPARAGEPDGTQLRDVASALLEANAPIISTDRLEAEAVPWLIELAEFLGAPVITGDTLFALPADHPLARGDVRSFPLPPETDIVLGVEAIVPWLPKEDGSDPRPRVALIGMDPVASATPLYDFPCHWALISRSDVALARLVDLLKARASGDHRERFRARRARLEAEGRVRWQRLVESAEAEERSGALTRDAALSIIGKTLDPEWVVFHEMVEPPLLRRVRPTTLFGDGGSGIGWAAAAALGAKVAKPDLPIVAVCGDGSWFFANPPACLWTAQYHGAPVIFIVMNNAGYRTGTVLVAKSYPDGFAARSRNFEGGWLSPSPDFAAEARALGCAGEQVKDPVQLAEALRRAMTAASVERTSTVLDVRLPPIGGVHP